MLTRVCGTENAPEQERLAEELAALDPCRLFARQAGDGDDADQALGAGRLIATGTAANPLVAGAVVAEPADVTVEADCPDA